MFQVKISDKTHDGLVTLYYGSKAESSLHIVRRFRVTFPLLSRNLSHNMWHFVKSLISKSTPSICGENIKGINNNNNNKYNINNTSLRRDAFCRKIPFVLWWFKLMYTYILLMKHCYFYCSKRSEYIFLTTAEGSRWDSSWDDYPQTLTDL